MSSEITILGNVVHTNLVTNFKIKHIVLGATTNLEAPVYTLQSTPLIFVECSYFATINKFCLTPAGTCDIRTYERQDSNIISCLDAILYQQGNLHIIVADILATTLRIVKTTLQEYGSCL